MEYDGCGGVRTYSRKGVLAATHSCEGFDGLIACLSAVSRDTISAMMN